MEINEKYLKNKLLFDDKKIKRILLMYEIAKKISIANKNELVLKGGTALLFCYGLQRYSTDLDYDGFNYNFKILDEIKSVFNSNGLELDKINIKKDTDTVKRYMLHYKEAENNPIKLEISFRNIDDVEYINKNIIQINNINTYNINYLAAKKTKKIEAFLNRTAARDIFDVSFLLQCFPGCVNKELLEKCKSKLSSIGLDQMENILKNDETLINFDCEGILVNFENNINKYLCNYKNNMINSTSRSRTI
jgi:predicted nucleotidyltransferase component of viral defense system